VTGDINIGFGQGGSSPTGDSGSVQAGSGAWSGAARIPPGLPDPLTPVQALAALRLLLSQYGSSLTDADRARARGEMAEIGDHLVADPPDPRRICGALDRLVPALASVPALTAGARTLCATVTRTFG
jgi:hypothetical protein